MLYLSMASCAAESQRPSPTPLLDRGVLTNFDSLLLHVFTLERESAGFSASRLVSYHVHRLDLRCALLVNESCLNLGGRPYARVSPSSR
jgi:hypothetical protein